jgi:hypothetical protein
VSPFLAVPLKLRRITMIGDYERFYGGYSILASEEAVREVTNGVTIDFESVIPDSNNRKIVKQGMPLGRLGNGKYAPYNPNGTDGSQNPTVILKHTVDVTSGNHVVGGYEMAAIKSNLMPILVDDVLRSKMRLISFW